MSLWASHQFQGKVKRNKSLCAYQVWLMETTQPLLDCGDRTQRGTIFQFVRMNHQVTRQFFCLYTIGKARSHTDQFTTVT